MRDSSRPEIFEEVAEALADALQRRRDDITPDTLLVDDLGMKGEDVDRLCVALQQTFRINFKKQHIAILTHGDWVSVGDIEKRMRAVLMAG